MDDERQEDRTVLAAAIRAIRTMRRMRASEVAREMGIPVRTYEHMEAGRGRYDFNRLRRFAQVTRCDIISLMTCVELRDPDFAVHSANNKAMTVMLHAFGELHEKLGSDFALVETRTLVGAAMRACKDLEEHFAKRDLFAEQWLSERTSRRSSTA